LDLVRFAGWKFGLKLFRYGGIVFKQHKILRLHTKI